MEQALISELKTAQREADKIRENRDKENGDPVLIKSLYVQVSLYFYSRALLPLGLFCP